MSYPVATRDAYPPELMELMSAAFDAAGGRLLGEPARPISFRSQQQKLASAIQNAWSALPLKP